MNSHLRDAMLVLCATFILSVLTLSGVGMGAAQEDLDISLDVPEETVINESTGISAEVTAPDRPTVFESEMTVTFYSDGEKIGSDTVSIRDGGTEQVDISHEFRESGETDIHAEASVSFGRLELSGSSRTRSLLVQTLIEGDLELKNFNPPTSPEVDEQTTTSVESEIPTLNADQTELVVRLYVDDEEVASERVDVDSGDSEKTELQTTFDTGGNKTVRVEAELTVGDQTVSKSAKRAVNVTLPTTRLDGVSFSVPDSLSDEVQDFRSSTSQDLETQAFVLATSDNLHIVFTQEEPVTGEASVEGVLIQRDLQTENITFGTIAATNTSFETTGTEADVREISNNVDQYRLELVRVSAQYRRASSLTDPDQENNFTASSTSGVLLANSQSAVSLLSNAGSNARSLSRDASAEQMNSILSDLRGPHLRTASLRTKFWTDSEATVDAVVLSPQSVAGQFIDEYDTSNIANTNSDKPILYVTEEDFDAQEFSDVSSIKSQSESLDGQVVETEARLYMEQISVQETVETNTPCVDLLQIQTPQGPTCVNVPQDNLLHAGVAWNEIPQSRDDGLLVMGVSSRHQDTPAEFVEGRYRIKGEIVSSSRFDDSIPEASVLVIYEMNRVSAIDYEAVASEAKSLIQTRTDDLTTQLREQVGEGGIVIATDSSSRTIDVAAPDDPGIVEFTQPEREPVTVQRANVSVTSEVRDVQVRSSNVVSLPTDVSQPPGNSIELLNVSTSAADETVASASFQIRVSSAAISGEADLTVYRYHDNEWNSLEVQVIEETDGAVILRVRTPGLSYFALSGSSDSDSASQQNDEKNSGNNEPESDDKDSSDSTPSTESESGDESSSASSTSNGSDETAAGESDSDDQIDPSQGEDTDGFSIILALASLSVFVGWRMTR